MPDKSDRDMLKEQAAQKRLTRLIEALPVFAGITSPDGHLLQAHPLSFNETYLWTLPLFTYSHESVSAVMDMCEKATKGERVQVEHLYSTGENSAGEPQLQQGLLTVDPIEDDGVIDALSITLVDCDTFEIGRSAIPVKSRLAVANRRISSMLSLAQTIVEVLNEFHDTTRQSSIRDRIAYRLDRLAQIIDLISNTETEEIAFDVFLDRTLMSWSSETNKHRIGLRLSDVWISVAYAPIMALLISELLLNAEQHGALSNQNGKVMLIADVIDSAQGRCFRMHWLEENGPMLVDNPPSGFGRYVGETLLPVITNGKSVMMDDPDGMNWTFEIPVSDTSAKQLKLAALLDLKDGDQDE